MDSQTPPRTASPMGSPITQIPNNTSCTTAFSRPISVLSTHPFWNEHKRFGHLFLSPSQKKRHQQQWVTILLWLTESFWQSFGRRKKVPSLGKQIHTKLQPSNIRQFQCQNNCPAPFQTCDCLKIWPKYSYLKAASLNNYNPKQFQQNTRSTQLQHCASIDSEARYENILLNNLPVQTRGVQHVLAAGMAGISCEQDPGIPVSCREFRWQKITAQEHKHTVRSPPRIIPE